MSVVVGMLQHDSEDAGTRAEPAGKSCRHHGASVDEGGGSLGVEAGTDSTRV